MAIQESNRVVLYSRSSANEELGPTLWVNGAIKRLELLSRPPALRTRQEIRECIEITSAAAAVMQRDRIADNFTVQIELAKLALLAGNRREFEKHCERAEFFEAQLPHDVAYLSALLWDARVRGEARFEPDRGGSLAHIQAARSSLKSRSGGRRLRAIELYISNSEIHALKDSPEPEVRARIECLRAEVKLEALLLGNPFQASRVSEVGLIGY